MSVTLVLAGNVDTTETVGELLRLFGVCVLFVVSGFRLLSIGQCARFCSFSDRLFVLNNGVCTTMIRLRFRNV